MTIIGNDSSKFCRGRERLIDRGGSVVKLYVLCLVSDLIQVERIAQRLRTAGHELQVVAREQFPIADSLAAELTSAGRLWDAVIGLLAADNGREEWVEAEMNTQSSLAGACRFVVMGGKSTGRAGRFLVFARDDVDALVHALGDAH